MKRITLFPIVLIGCILSSPCLAAQGEFPGSNGKPFQALQEQIDAVDLSLAEQMAAVWVAVAENNARDDAQDVLIGLLGAALADLEARVTTNETDIELLKAKDAVLEGLITALQDRADDLQQQINDQEDQIQLIILADQALQQLIDALTARVATLEGLMATAGTDIDTLQAQVAALQSQMAGAQAAIASKQNLIWDYCGSGYSIRRIYSNGSVSCEYDSTSTGGFTSFTVDREIDYGDAIDATVFGTVSAIATCPTGSKRTGGGFWVYSDVMFVNASYPYGINGWKTYVRGSWPIPLEFRSYVNCLTMN